MKAAAKTSLSCHPLRSIDQALFVTDGAVQRLNLGLEIESFPRLLERCMPIGGQETGGLFDVRSAILDKGRADLPKDTRRNE